MPIRYSNFTVLLDDAAEQPHLGFSDYATALAEIIRDSRAEFAVGIFGTWGTGKTTLMRQIERQLQQPGIATAWFTAWRYEREPHLIIPLIDVLREALEKQAKAEGEGGPARRAADIMKRAGRAFLAGLTLSAKVPGLDASLDVDKAIAAFADKRTDETGSLSFYHSAFLLLRRAIAEFSAGGTRRLVVFVDDLDRCFPPNALDVLESMKLFFDVEGVVFVVGLDQAVAERAVALKYEDRPSDTSARVPVSGVDYLKKIFQVPFALPRVGTDLLDEYLWSIRNSAEFGPEQRQDFDDHVRPHLVFLPDQDAINPREVKRLINTYVVQLKMLHNRLGDGMNPDIVLALQCMNFRPDWRDLYEELAADPLLFQQSVRAVVGDPETTGEVWFGGRKVVLPTQFLEYVRGVAQSLLQDPRLSSYVSAAESTRSTDPTLLDAQALVNRLRSSVEELVQDGQVAPNAARSLQNDLQRLADMLSRKGEQPAFRRPLKELTRLMEDLTRVPADKVGQLPQRFTEVIDSLDSELRELRRRASLGATA